MPNFFMNLPKDSLILMEACGSANFWARKAISFGHTVKLIAPQFVKPFVKSQKNDADCVAWFIGWGRGGVLTKFRADRICLKKR